MQKPYSVAKGKGYEVSSKGDRRFSALFAEMPDGRTLEMHYQCDLKGFGPGGSDWRAGKGQPPKGDISREDLWEGYLTLWRTWAYRHRAYMLELIEQAAKFDNQLSDVFASSDINQARALVTLLNEDVDWGEISISVVNKYHFQPPKTISLDDPTVFCIMRGNALGNPFPLKKPDDRAKVVGQFREWFNEHKETDPDVYHALNFIEDAAVFHGHIRLQCVCNPAQCHGHVIRDELIQRLEAKGFTIVDRRADALTPFNKKASDAIRLVLPAAQCPGGVAAPVVQDPSSPSPE